MYVISERNTICVINIDSTQKKQSRRLPQNCSEKEISYPWLSPPRALHSTSPPPEDYINRFSGRKIGLLIWSSFENKITTALQWHLGGVQRGRHCDAEIHWRDIQKSIANTAAYDHPCVFWSGLKTQNLSNWRFWPSQDLVNVKGQHIKVWKIRIKPTKKNVQTKNTRKILEKREKIDFIRCLFLRANPRSWEVWRVTSTRTKLWTTREHKVHGAHGQQGKGRRGDCFWKQRNAHKLAGCCS